MPVKCWKVEPLYSIVPYQVELTMKFPWKFRQGNVKVIVHIMVD
jgi:hypothetical protein